MYECGICSQSFADADALAQHTAQDHPAPLHGTDPELGPTPMVDTDLTNATGTSDSRVGGLLRDAEAPSVPVSEPDTAVEGVNDLPDLGAESPPGSGGEAVQDAQGGLASANVVGRSRSDDMAPAPGDGLGMLASDQFPVSPPPPESESVLSEADVAEGSGSYEAAVDGEITGVRTPDRLDVTPEVEGEGALAGAPDDAISTDPWDRLRRHRWRLVVAVVVVLAAMAGGTAWWLGRGPSRKEQYLEALSAAGLRAQFPVDDLAVANARRVCSAIDDGGKTEGYAVDRVGVEYYCPDYLKAFKVVPTPAELEKDYLGKLRQAGLMGQFASDATAVAAAKRTCDDLDGGSKAQGLPQDRIAVEVYCDKYLAGFRTLRVSTVKGTFTLYDLSPSYYFPSITQGVLGCEGSGGYGDIGPGTQVVLKDNTGAELVRTELGPGVGGASVGTCRFEFSFSVTEGADSYILSVGRRGETAYTFATLIEGPTITLGL